MGDRWPSGQPNVLYMLADDMRPELAYLSHGQLPIVTPFLDKLASKSAYFDNAFNQAAVCVPSRASFLSGMRPYATSIISNDQRLRFGSAGELKYAGVSAFRAAGYATAGIGKIGHKHEAHPDYTLSHTGSTDLLHAPCNEEGAQNRRMHAPDQFVSCRVQGNNFRDEGVRKHALEALRTLAKHPAPFFMIVGFLRPHVPDHVPTWAMRQQPPVDWTEPPRQPLPRLSPLRSGKGGSTNSTRAEKERLQRWECAQGAPKGASVDAIHAICLRHAKRVYRAAVTYTDHNMGVLLKELGLLRVRNQTIVVMHSE